jgi:hypothetical protein
MKTIQEHWEVCAKFIARYGDQPLMKANAELHPDWSKDTQAMALAEAQFGQDWIDSGRITYELSHSLAAMFSLTSCPDIDHLPHHAFAIKVPREFLPLDGAWASADSWIAVGERAAMVAILAIPDSDTTPVSAVFFPIPETTGKTLEKELAASLTKKPSAARLRVNILARRLATNTIAYVLSHREQLGCVEAKQVTPERATFLVRPPRDVVIDRAFRDAAQAAVCATDLIGTRRALAHVVRGHWRNQAVGTNWSDRRRTWIHPHRRGDESLGSVVARTERLVKEPENLNDTR